MRCINWYALKRITLMSKTMSAIPIKFSISISFAPAKAGAF